MSEQINMEQLELQLSDKQRKAAWLLNQNELASNIDGKKRNLDEIADEVGVDRRTLYNWRKKDRNFIAYQNMISDVTLFSFRQEADEMLMKLIRGGNNGLGSIRALQLYYQMIGKLVNKSETTIISEETRKRTTRLSDAEVSERLSELDKLLN